MNKKLHNERGYKLNDTEYKWFNYLLQEGYYNAVGGCNNDQNTALAVAGARALTQMEDRINKLETIIAAIVDYRFPDGNSMSSGGTFTLRGEFNGCYADKKEKQAYKIINELYGR